MKELFYIVNTKRDSKEGWYQLRVLPTHYCISGTSSFPHILETVKKYCKKYKNEERVLEALSELEDGGKVGINEKIRVEHLYKSQVGLYDEYIEEVVDEAMKEIREERKNNNPLKKAAQRLKKVGKVITTSSIEKEVVQEKIDFPVGGIISKRKPIAIKPHLLRRRFE